MKTKFLIAYTLILSLVCAGVVRAQLSLEIDPENSHVTWKGAKITGKEHKGEIKIKSGKVELDGTQLSGGNVEMDMNSIACTDLEGAWAEKLNKHLKESDFFDVGKYPTSSFVVKKVDYLGNKKVKIKGDLTIKGKTQNLSFDGAVDYGDGKLTLEADNVQIDRSKFEAQGNSLLGKVKDLGIANMFQVSLKIVTKISVGGDTLKKGVDKVKNILNK